MICWYLTVKYRSISVNPASGCHTFAPPYFIFGIIIFAKVIMYVCTKENGVQRRCKDEYDTDIFEENKH